MLPGNLASLSLRAGPNAQEKAAGFNVIGQGMGLAIGPRRGGAASDRAADTVSRCGFSSDGRRRPGCRRFADVRISDR